MRPVAVVDEARDAVDLVLEDPGLGGAHGLEDREAGEARRPLDERDLARALDEPRVVERGGEVADLDPGIAVAQVPHQDTLARGAAVEGVAARRPHRAQRAVAAHREPLGRLEGHENDLRRPPLPVAGEGLAEQVRPRHRVDAAELRHELRVLRRQDLPLHPLGPLVAVREEDRRPPARPVEEEVRVRHLDAAQVVEVVGLPEAQVALGGRRSLHERDALRPDRVVDLRPAGGELLGGEVRGEQRRVLGEGQRRGHENGEREGRRDAREHSVLRAGVSGPGLPRGFPERTERTGMETD